VFIGNGSAPCQGPLGAQRRRVESRFLPRRFILLPHGLGRLLGRCLCFRIRGFRIVGAAIFARKLVQGEAGKNRQVVTTKPQDEEYEVRRRMKTLLSDGCARRGFFDEARQEKRIRGLPINRSAATFAKYSEMDAIPS